MDIRSALQARGIRPSKRMGQYFLADEEVVARMVAYAAVGSEDEVLEIGAGMGSLTEALDRNAKKVYAVEKDAALCAILRDRFGLASSRTTILEGDVLSMELPHCAKVVASIPFQVSSPLTIKLMTHEPGFAVAVLLYQQEFAEKLIARPRTKAYGRLSVVAQALAEVDLLELVPRGAFYPPAPVKTAIVRLKARTGNQQLVADKVAFLSFVTAAFEHRRKKLKWNLAAKQQEGEVSAVMEKRAEELSPAEFVLLAGCLSVRAEI
jgi:16S rRNA (adenine1518-N6/adenine1519-N6)-dimethyltransferase